MPVLPSAVEAIGETPLVEPAGAAVLVLLNDSGLKYLSTDLWE